MNAHSFNNLTNLSVLTSEILPEMDLSQLQQHMTLHDGIACDTLHPGVLAIIAGSFISIILSYWLVFRNSSEAAFMVVISAVYLTMYIGTPFVMYRVRQVHKPLEDLGNFRDFLNGKMHTATGPLTGWEATIQACCIPVALTLATIGICIVIVMTG